MKLARSKLCLEVKKLPPNPTISQQLTITRMQARLRKKIKDFLNESNIFLPHLEDDDLKPFEEELIDTPDEDAVEPEDALDEYIEEDAYEEEEDEEAPSELPESIILPLPSNIISKKFGPSFDSLRLTERELRKGQANDALEGIRIGLANKSMLFLTDVKNSTSTKQSTRAWTSVQNTQSQILHHSHAYQRAWQALRRVGTEEDLEVYQRLDQKDLVVIKDITNAKHFRQGSDRLAWFWRIGPREDALTGKWMEECKSNGLTVLCFISFH